MPLAQGQACGSDAWQRRVAATRGSDAWQRMRGACLRIGCVRIAHRTARVAKGPERWQGMAAAQPREAARDLQHTRPQDHRVVQIATRLQHEHSAQATVECVHSTQ